MPRIAGCAIATPYGRLAETVAALAAARGGPGMLTGDLCERLLEVAGEALAGNRPDLVVLATTKADVDRWCGELLAETGGYAGGPAWLAAELGARLGAPAFAVSSACASGPLAIGVAARWLLAGRARRVLVIGGDRCGAFVRDGFAALQAIDPVGCRPFDASRVGLRLGESAAAILLDRDDGMPGDRFVQGWGASMDANHLTGPTRDGSGLAAACRRALARAGSSDPALVVAHGTGTRYNDDSESLAYAAICPRTPVTGVKGLLGHSLGACGVVEAALAQEFHRRRAAPGTAGLERQGCAGAISVLPPGEHALGAGPVLAANAGFGGLDGALVIGDRAPARWSAPAFRLLGQVELGAQGWTRGRAGSTVETVAWNEPGEGETLPKLTSKEVTGHIDASWGRMDLACRALVTLGHLLAPIPADCAVVLVTNVGCAATDRAFEESRRAGNADPQRFPYTLPTTPIGELSIRLKLRGPGLALLGASPEQARQVAEDLFAECPAVLLAWIDADRPPHRARAELWVPA
jgi:hypothetical protein